MASVALPVAPGAPARGRTISPGRYFLIGGVVIALVFGGLIGWSVLAPFEGAVMAQGSVGVESRHKAIQHLEGGIVAEIAVRDGDHVEEGQLLLRLDGTPIRAQLENVDARLVDLLAREARLIAERDDRSEISLRAVSPEIAALPGLPASEANQAALFATRAESRRTQVSILNQRISQLREGVTGIEAEILSKIEQTRLIDDELTGLQTLLRDGLAQRPQVLALQREKSSLLGQIDSLRAQSAATEVKIGETRLEILGMTEGFREDVIAQLVDVQTEIAALLSERAAASDRLQRLDIRAPRAGIVLGSRTHTVGGVIAPGDPVMHIVPDNDELVTLVRVMPQDIDKIYPGQSARLRFSAFDSDKTPEVTATVKTISADTVQDPQTGANYYEVTIALPEQTPLGEDFEIVPGMPVEAMMQTESRNVLSYLVKPLTDSMNRPFRE